MSFSSLFIFVLTLIYSSNGLSCGLVKARIYTSLDKLYGECGKCYSYYKPFDPLKEVSYTVDCPNNRFVIYTNVSCVGGIDSYVTFENDYNDYCTSDRCCLMKRLTTGTTSYLLYYADNCTNSCFSGGTSSAYFRFFNSSFLYYHETNDCVDSKPQYTTQLICDQVRNYPTSTIIDSKSNSVSQTYTQSQQQQQKSISKKEFEVRSIEGVLVNFTLIMLLLFY